LLELPPDTETSSISGTVFLYLLFGTLYMPPGEQPKHFGVRGNAVPQSLWAQMVYPFTRVSKPKESRAG
jgi:hypothetical protein